MGFLVENERNLKFSFLEEYRKEEKIKKFFYKEKIQIIFQI